MSILLTEDDVAAFGMVALHNAESSHSAGYKLTLILKDEKDYEQFSSVTKRRKNRAGVRYRMYLLSSDSSVCRDVDVFFLCWSVTNASGARVKFELSDPDDFDFFRELPAGTEWSMTLIEIDDEEKVVDQKQKEIAETVKGGPKSVKAGILCADPDFQIFVAQKTGISKMRGPGVVRARNDECADYIREKCRIKSRAELDHDPAAFDRFTKWVSKPFAIWSEGR